MNHAKSSATATAQLVAHIKALATQNDAQSRMQCNAASKSLIEIVSQLVSFIQPGQSFSSGTIRKPFAAGKSIEELSQPSSTSVSFSPEARARTAFILDQTRTTADAAKALLLPLKQEAEALPIPILQTTARSLHEACIQLAKVCKDASPGQQEAENAIQKISNACNALEAKIIKLSSGESSNDGQSEESTAITQQAISQGLFHVKKAFDLLQNTTSADKINAETIEQLERLGDDYTNVRSYLSRFVLTLTQVSLIGCDVHVNIAKWRQQYGNDERLGSIQECWSCHHDALAWLQECPQRGQSELESLPYYP